MQTLTVVKETSFGVYLAETGRRGDGEEARVLLPKKQVPKGCTLGEKLEVFIYKDSEDRLIATVSKPKLTLGETAVLEVKEATDIGTFLDMGLEKDLLLPFKEQTYPVKKGEKCLVSPLRGQEQTTGRHHEGVSVSSQRFSLSYRRRGHGVYF